MKKLIITVLLIVSMVTGLQSMNFGETGGVVYANAATKVKVNLSKPKTSLVKMSAKKVDLSINKVAGATKYKIYRATSVDGKYKCIGTTKKSTFTDKKVKNNKNYYYKVKACKTGSKKTELSPYSNIVSVYTPSPKDDQVVTSTAPTVTKRPVTTQATAEPITAKPTVAPETQTGGSSNQNYADEVLRLLNQERAKAGLNALTTNTTLQNAANKRAVETVTSFSHTRPNGSSFSSVLGEFNISYRAAGENIAWGQSTPSEVMTGWMNSPGHKANILGSQFGKVGIGVHKASNGRYYWTQVFTN